MTRRIPPLVAATLLLPAALFAASGGPDAAGYTWTDEADPTIDWPTTTTPLVLADEEVSAPINLGFSFPFYGASYTQFVISSNGWLSFDTALTNPYPTPQALPAATAPNRTFAFFWRDLDRPDDIRSEHGAIPGGYYIRVVTNIPGGNPLSIDMRMALYQSGLIKVSYQALEVPETASVGIENAAGDIGLNPSYLGTGSNGFVLASGKTLTFFPPPQLNCSAPGTITCGQTLSFSSPASVSPNVTGYLCNSTVYSGRERVIRFDNPTLADVRVTLATTTPGIDLDVVMLKQNMCNEFQCLAAGDTAVTRNYLAAGTYFLVVDGKAASDNGNFDLTVACTPKSAQQPCQPPGSPPVRGTTSGVSQWNGYDCSNLNFDGPEFVYEIPFTAPGNIKFRLTPDPGVQLGILAFGPDAFDAPNGCAGVGINSLTLFDPPSGTYYFVVDGWTDDPPDPAETNAGGYEFTVNCDILLDCAAPAGDLQCFQETSGTTVGAQNRAEIYSCSGVAFTGPEVVYRFRNDVQRDVAFKWTGPADLSMFLVQATCNEGACLRYGSRNRLVARDLPVGDYYVVVDGLNGASGSFTIKPICANKVDPPSGSWVLSPPATVHETKALTVTGSPTYGDIMFLVDDTGSMGGPISNLKTTTQAIITQLNQQVDDVAFGLANFEDYPFGNPGTDCAGRSHDASDQPYRLLLPITTNLRRLFDTIDTLGPRGGGDGPESYLHSYFMMYADAGNIRWRNGARQIAVMMGDNDAHSCDTDYCGTPRAQSGREFGPDYTPGTADDIEVIPLMNELGARGITPLFLQTNGAGTLLDQWDCWTRIAGGQAYDFQNGQLPPGSTLIPDIRKVVESRTLICYALTVRTTPGFESWVTNLTPGSMTDVYLPAEVTFDLDVGPPAGTTPGIYNFEIQFLCDGEVKATQTVSIEVPGVCTPNVSLGLSGTTCPGDARTLDASASVINGCNAPAFVEWQWKDDLGNVIRPWDRNGSVLVVNPTVSTEYTVEIRCSDQAACPFTGSRLQQVPVDPNPPADAGPDVTVCLTETVALGAPGSPAHDYLWSPQTELDNPFVAQPNFSTSATAPTGPRVYTVTVTDPATGCTSTDTVTVDVVDGAPVGRIGNTLYARRAGADVYLEWRLGPLSIRNYNVHREGAKTAIDPPASPPIGQASSDEIYTDVGAVPAPALFFYEVYGRDCAGNSIFN